MLKQTILFLLLLCASLAYAAAIPPAYLDDSGEILLPIKYVCDWVGITARPGTQENTVVVTSNDAGYILTADSRIVMKGEEKIELAAPVVKRSGITYAPLAFFSDQLGLSVAWSGARGEASIIHPQRGTWLVLIEPKVAKAVQPAQKAQPKPAQPGRTTQSVPQRPANTPAAPSNSYRDLDGHFAITYPPDWEVQPVEREGSYAMHGAIGPPIEKANTLGAYASVGVIDAAVPPEMIDEAAQAFLCGVKQNATNYKQLGIKETVLKGMPAREITFSLQEKDTLLQGVAYIVVSRSDTYILLGISCYSDFTYYRPIFNNIFFTFRPSGR